MRVQVPLSAQTKTASGNPPGLRAHRFCCGPCGLPLFADLTAVAESNSMILNTSRGYSQAGEGTELITRRFLGSSPSAPTFHRQPGERAAIAGQWRRGLQAYGCCWKSIQCNGETMRKVLSSESLGILLGGNPRATFVLSQRTQPSIVQLEEHALFRGKAGSSNLSTWTGRMVWTMLRRPHPEPFGVSRRSAEDRQYTDQVLDEESSPWRLSPPGR